MVCTIAVAYDTTPWTRRLLVAGLPWLVPYQDQYPACSWCCLAVNMPLLLVNLLRRFPVGGFCVMSKC